MRKDKKMQNKFDTLSVMLDASRNGVPTVKFLKQFVILLEKLGYNQLQLYTEDTYTLKGEEYFGRLRGRYTGEEIKEIDAFAAQHNIELVPCIQTLAHLSTVFKWPVYSNSVRDCNDILLADNEKTYALIDKMFSFCADNFTSRKINIGMDEAHMLGLGKYLDINGYKPRYEIMLNHLKRVNQIARKYGFCPMMWSDMFFKFINGGDYYVKEGEEVEIPDKLKEDIPKDITLIYWDYSSQKSEEYRKMLNLHSKLTSNVAFAGGATRWIGFAPFNRFSFTLDKAAFEALNTEKIKTVTVTMWGDDGNECPAVAVLPVLAHYAMFNQTGKNDEQSLAAFFREKLDLELNDFLLLDKINHLCGEGDFINKIKDPCKYMLYNDPLIGMFDYYEDISQRGYFAELSEELDAAAKRNFQYGYVFESLSRLSAFLSVKAGLGKEMKQAYKRGDGLAEFLPCIIKCINKLDDFINAFGKSWLAENKPFGKEIADIRLGGLKERYRYLNQKAEDFCLGKISRIEEFEQEILPYDGDEEQIGIIFYHNIASPGVF